MTKEADRKEMPFDKVGLFSIALLLSMQLVIGHTGQICFPFDSQTTTNNSQAVVSQGRPGKIGPAGPVGPKGDRGVAGPTGACVCDTSELERLRKEVSGRLVVASGVGMKSGRITNAQISASSVYKNALGVYFPHFARLDHIGTSKLYQGWLAYNGCNAAAVRGQWIQVDLRQPTRVVAVVTQGISYPGSAPDRVTSYKISYGNRANSMRVITGANGQQMVFPGNTKDRETHVINEFPSPVTARYFRLIVETMIACATVRLEYLVC